MSTQRERELEAQVHQLLLDKEALECEVDVLQAKIAQVHQWTAPRPTLNEALQALYDTQSPPGNA